MKKFFVAGALTLLASTAYAVDQMYVTSEGDKWTVMGGTNAQGTELLQSDNGAKPSNCPAGSFYSTDQQTAIACDNESKFTMAAPESGTMGADGKPYPEGSMLLNPAQ